ncbi:unnamed protein product [Linum trigynum]|uniref:Uncharacterized protein n=1 Tax=Linum trigynum TaxID=586398 RepID=A0AAV2EPW9_9ROSI
MADLEIPSQSPPPQDAGSGDEEEEEEEGTAGTWQIWRFPHCHRRRMALDLEMKKKKGPPPHGARFGDSVTPRQYFLLPNCVTVEEEFTKPR